MTFYFFSFYYFSIRHRAYFILRHCLRPYYWIGLDTVSHDELDHDLSRNFSISLCCYLSDLSEYLVSRYREFGGDFNCA